MDRDDDLSGGALAAITCSIGAALYMLPFIHYFCIGRCKTKKYRREYGTTISTINVENQYAISREESKEIRKSEKSFTRVLSMHFTFWAHAWIVYFAVTSTMSDEQIGGEMARLLLNVVGYVHLPAFILFLWVETFFSWEFDYICSILEEQTSRAYIHELQQQEPVKLLCVEAYHFETRTRTVTRTDANGRTITSTETYQEHVRDHWESLRFPFTRWEDLSADPNTLNLDPGKVTRIKMLQLVLLGDDQTEAEFRRLRTEMEDKVRRLYPTSILEFTEHDRIPLFEKRICAFWEVDEKPWWTNRCLYIILSLLLLTWIYRIAFTFATQATCYRVVKKIYI